jgi:hypothetical protein
MTKKRGGCVTNGRQTAQSIAILEPKKDKLEPSKEKHYHNGENAVAILKPPKER